MKKIIIEKATEKKITNLFEKVGTQTNQASKKLTREKICEQPRVIKSTVGKKKFKVGKWVESHKIKCKCISKDLFLNFTNLSMQFTWAEWELEWFCNFILVLNFLNISSSQDRVTRIKLNKKYTSLQLSVQRLSLWGWRRRGQRLEYEVRSSGSLLQVISNQCLTLEETRISRIVCCCCVLSSYAMYVFGWECLPSFWMSTHTNTEKLNIWVELWGLTQVRFLFEVTPE